MWITLFMIVIGIAACFALAAMTLDSHEGNSRF
jgi:hypothetical protein